ncbi:MAG: hypothetical protein DMF78_08120 [Acidobacteria bacterium]|nr:MAG: hypothetical protein DMF78_08120 [Acidobacteriota bacterium]
MNAAHASRLEHQRSHLRHRREFTPFEGPAHLRCPGGKIRATRNPVGQHADREELVAGRGRTGRHLLKDPGERFFAAFVDRIRERRQFRAVRSACDAELGMIADAFGLMLVTAQRRGEVLSMRWRDVDGAWWTIPTEVAKNGRSHRVPLSPQALAILDQLSSPAILRGSARARRS